MVSSFSKRVFWLPLRISFQFLWGVSTFFPREKPTETAEKICLLGKNHV